MMQFCSPAKIVVLPMFSNISTLCAAAAGRRSTLFRPRRHRGLASGWLDEKRTGAAAEGHG
ncbi:hypothetical protein FQJ88_15990 [Xanthomonas vasicola]|uniref:Uncharacterized protein n=1 Tax=Xanthomonas vasicola TaxID=56459 RepID=A0ABD7S8G1_XANVA|nr:hypothetical protein NX81_006540 [Xanthomonas vasicola]TWQ29092.1 hypothetical protein FQJ97_17020 [Xanthomonas vasicola]TWQ38173.1 hypothetical protein FQJ96_12575 [Xanthomonas vasicola]TWQ51663.1 hypothetical protein FQK01_14735 [Xanthomonas vasicola]TWQ53885.1 hypothetical protein FQJ94_13645 [Xanthomonas vasicola]